MTVRLVKIAVIYLVAGMSLGIWMGIAQDQLDRLFRPFQRGPGSSGLGVGLFLAHTLVKYNGGTLTAAEWVILVTSLNAQAWSSAAIGDLYRARWRIEMAFKRLKSILGLEGPPGGDPKIAKTWILAHLLMVLLLEPHISAPEISPRLAA